MRQETHTHVGHSVQSGMVFLTLVDHWDGPIAHTRSFAFTPDQALDIGRQLMTNAECAQKDRDDTADFLGVSRL